MPKTTKIASATLAICLLNGCSMFEYKPWLFTEQTWEGLECISSGNTLYGKVNVTIKINKVDGNSVYLTSTSIYKGKTKIDEMKGLLSGYNLEVYPTKIIKNNPHLGQDHRFNLQYLPITERLISNEVFGGSCRDELTLKK